MSKRDIAIAVVLCVLLASIFGQISIDSSMAQGNCVFDCSPPNNFCNGTDTVLCDACDCDAESVGSKEWLGPVTCGTIPGTEVLVLIPVNCLKTKPCVAAAPLSYQYCHWDPVNGVHCSFNPLETCTPCALGASTTHVINTCTTTACPGVGS